MLSLQGATFLRGKLPESDLVKGGRYLSPYFAGPAAPEGPRNPSRSLIRQAASLGPDRPLPSMLLGYAGPRGMTTGQVLAGLRRSAAADGSRPRDPIGFFTNANVRTTARAWQLPEVAEELAGLGVPSLFSNQPSPDQPRLAGLMTGTATFSPTNYPALVPGAMAEHLTSFGAAFHTEAQSKITEWLKAGAAASAGTVLEPRAIWTKFPHARYFVHAAQGCTILESFFQSIASPLETLLLGDPLCHPWSSPVQVLAADLSDLEADAKHLVVGIQVLGVANAPRTMLRTFLDGCEFQPQPTMPLRLPTRDLADGYHELRIVAYSGTEVFRQGFATLGFKVNHQGRSVEILLPERDSPLPLDSRPEVSATFTGEPERLELLANGQVLATSDQPQDPLRVDLTRVGRGPSNLQLRALYPDGMQVLSAPASIAVD